MYKYFEKLRNIKKPSKYWKIFTILLAILYIITLSDRDRRAYNNIFRLSYEQIRPSLRSTQNQCKKFNECELIPGDIIIRRYVTNNVLLMDEIFNIYFTHSAIYLGNDELFEALGGKVKPEDQISIRKLSKSDWLNEDMNSFVILRPKNYNGKLDEIIKSLKNIADDSEYTFGPLDETNKTGSCSDIILKYIEDEGVIKKINTKPRIISPDYLFWITKTDPNFDIVGFNIEPKTKK